MNRILSSFLFVVILFPFSLCSQTFNWAQLAKRNSDNNGIYSHDVCIDNNKNVISAGYFVCLSTDQIVFDSQSFTGFQTSAFLYHGYFSKYDNNGVIQWARRIGNSAGEAQVRGVTADGSGNVYVSGYFTQTCRFGCPQTGSCAGLGTAVTSLGSGDGFLAKYDAAGNFLWVKTIRGTGDVRAERTRFTTNSNSVYVSGRFSGTTAFGEGGAQVNLTASGSGEDVFIAKYNLNGDLLWVRQGSCTQWSYASSMAVDQNDNVYVGGHFREQIVFGATTLSGVGGSFQINPYVVKYNGSGTVQWARSYASTTNVDVTGIAVDQSMNVYFGGGFYDQLTIGSTTHVSDYGNTVTYMAKLNSSGNVVWSKKTGTRPNSSGWSTLNAMAVNTQGDIYAFGLYVNNCTFDGNVVSDYGTNSYNVWLSTWDTNGNLMCITRAAGTREDYAKGIVVDSDGVSYQAGDSFGWPAGTYNCNWGTHTLYPVRTSIVTSKTSWAPVTAGPISGPIEVCDSESGVVFTVPNIPGATFTWTVPSGATITSGQGTNSITVTFGSTGGLVCVSALGVCVHGPQTCISVTIPSPGGTGLWTWTGTYSTDWFNACNWDKKTVPTFQADVLIPGATPFQPTITGTMGHCNTITIATTNGAILTIQQTAGGSLQVHQ